ncbi:hypothetical protein HCN44_009045 [Aphidius gifuensis]|uniref:Uncharacterized protein n=1 Tax=Aphidius gifuensis TaxID=684658 RepID=A0A834Y3D8_APHGI|nr:hypothetical protein HCN44_009045 [Aphidius gifuensis]
MIISGRRDENGSQHSSKEVRKQSISCIFKTMLDLNLLKSPLFLLLTISDSLTMLGFYTPFMYLLGNKLIKS